MHYLNSNSWRLICCNQNVSAFPGIHQVYIYLDSVQWILNAIIYLIYVFPMIITRDNFYFLILIRLNYSSQFPLCLNTQRLDKGLNSQSLSKKKKPRTNALIQVTFALAWNEIRTNDQWRNKLETLCCWLYRLISLQKTIGLIIGVFVWLVVLYRQLHKNA